jgi:ABC-type transport system involved in multi-copper enzyme maturation permease subunit
MTSTLTRPTTNDQDTLIDLADLHTPNTSDARTSTVRVTLSRVANSEWIKFRTVRSNIIALGGSVGAAVGFGALFASLAGSDDGPGRLAENGLSLSLGGFQLSQIIIAILGVALVAGEYQTGLIRTWFGAAPDRMRVLAAKVGVFGSLVFGTSLVAAVGAFLAGQALLPAGFTALTLGSAGVAQALVGAAFYMACIGVIGIGLGFLLRSTAAGAGAVVTMLMIAPIMVGLLPSSIGDTLGKLLPSNAGSAVQGIETTNELLSAGWGVVVLLGWVAAIVGAAAVSLKRRDA